MGDRARFAPILGAVLVAGVVATPPRAAAAPGDGSAAPAGSNATPESKPDATPAQPEAAPARADDADTTSDTSTTPEAATDAGSDPATSGGAAAKPAVPVKDPRLARKWLSAARRLVRRGDRAARAGKADEAKQDYTNAITAYQKAIESGDDVSLYLQLAEAEAKAGSHAAAYKHLQFLADPNSKARPYIVKKAKAMLDELSMEIGTVKLTITPDGTTVMLGNETVGVSPLSDPLVLEPGSYQLSLTAVGFQPKEIDMRIDAGSESERTIDLDPVPVVVKTPPPAAAPPPPPAPHPSKLPLYLGGGATAGLAIAGTVTGILAIERHSKYVDPKTSSAQRDSARKSGRRLAHVTDACLGAAIAAGAFTAYWYFFQYRPAAHAAGEEHAAAKDGAKVGVVPWVQPDAGGLVVAGRF